jgi:hypothetical protein
LIQQPQGNVSIEIWNMSIVQTRVFANGIVQILKVLNGIVMTIKNMAQDVKHAMKRIV